MEMKPFQAESRRLMDLMIHSIYTHKEIFLREIISNASDAIDKLAYLALTDEGVGLDRDEFEIRVTVDKDARTLTVSDNGIGMSRAALEENLGTIAKSGSLQFKQEIETKDDAEIDIIGQFGVGFYSAFMVAEQLSVVSRAYGSETAFRWASEGVEGYTIAEAERAAPGTDVIMRLKADTEEEEYGKYLETRTLAELVRKYSDYIRYPIRMEMEKTVAKERPEDAPEDYKTEYETVSALETLNSMVPLWQRPKAQVSEEEYQSFYREKFMDWEEPAAMLHLAAEGTLEYKALLYIPARAPMDFYSSDYEKGLQLYSSGVMIMERCAELLPDHFSFVRGVVDSPDVSLNISREMLQHDRQLRVIAKHLEKRIANELKRLLSEEREKYEAFWSAFGPQLKYSLINRYGEGKESLQELLLFFSSKDKALVSLSEYRARMPESQQYIYYVVAESVERAAALPQAERVLEAGFEVLYLTAQEDELLFQVLGEVEGKALLSVASEEALPISDADKSRAEEAEEAHKELLAFVKEELGEAVSAVRISKILKSAAAYLSSEGPFSIEMEKYFRKMKAPMPTGGGHVLELNPDAPAFAALSKAFTEDPARAKDYVQLLYGQALLIADLPLPKPVDYARLISSLME